MKSRIVYLTFLSAMLWLPIYIHPTEVFDMIAGTSVGALMAFALVGGKARKTDDHSGERDSMTMQEVVDFMKETTDEI